jgi:ferredoxin
MDSAGFQIGGLTVRIDRLICVGFETCAQMAPELFQLDEEGIVVFKVDAAGVPTDLVLEACRSCPVEALQVLDASGNQLVP